MLNFKVLTNIALQIPPWATPLLFFFNNFENKGYSSGENCAKVNDVSECAHQCNVNRVLQCQ